MKRLLFLLLSLFLILIVPTYAATCTASQNGDWNDPATWSGCVVPATDDDVVIPSGISVTTTTVVTRDVGTSTNVQSGGSLSSNNTFWAFGTFSNSGTLSVDGPRFNNHGTLNNSGTIYVNALLDSAIGSVVNNYGTIIVNALFDNDGTMNNRGLYDNRNGGTENEGTFNNIHPGEYLGDPPVAGAVAGDFNQIGGGSSSTSPTSTTTGSSSIILPTSITSPDDRLNFGHGDTSHGIVYSRSDNGITVYGINGSSEGYLGVHLPLDAMPDCDPPPAENQLLASSEDGKYNIYLLTTCEYQINIGPDAEGKVQVVIFEGVPADMSSVKYYDFNVYDILSG